MPMEMLFTKDSSGAITGLGISTRWTTSQCIQAFGEIYVSGLVRRVGSSVPGLGWVLSNLKSKFETTPFESALKSAFGSESCLFGGRYSRRSLPNTIKVAVNADLDLSTPVLLTNYNRQRHIDGTGLLCNYFIFFRINKF
jgi:hypothetical protein